jgi:predicted dehydrogenase
MADRVTIGMIGCGGMAGAHVKGFKGLWEKELRDFEIVATCDLVESAASAMADSIAEWQGIKPRVYTDYEEMLRSEPDMMAVDVVTVHRSHHEIVGACFEAGKHVTVEKPLAITMRAGKQMLGDAEKAGTLFQVTENYRRSEENRAIKWAIDTGMIGKLRQIYWVDVQERLWYWNWRDHVSAAGGGWPLDGGVHFADLFRYHIGEPESIYCAVRRFHPVRYEDPDNMKGPIDVDVEDTTLGVINFPNEVVGLWSYSLAAPGREFSERAVYGSDGSITWGTGLKTRSDELTVDEMVAAHWKAIGPDGVEQLFPRGITDTIATELHEFVQAVLHGTPIEITGLEGYKDEALSIALYESSELNRPVTPAEVEALKVETYQNRINDGLEGLR